MFIANIRTRSEMFKLDGYNYRSLSVGYCSIFELDGYNYQTQQKTAINIEFNFGLYQS